MWRKWRARRTLRAGRPTGSERTHIATRGDTGLAAEAPGSWGVGTGWGKDRDWGDPAKGPREPEGYQGRAGEGKGKGVENGEGGHGQVAVAAQAHLGECWETARGLAQTHPRRRGQKPGSTRNRLVAGFSCRSSPYPGAGPAATSGPAPILSANSLHRRKTEVEKPFRLETGGPIGSRESLGWRGRRNSKLLQASTLGRGFKSGQSAHGICWGQQRAELVDQCGWTPGTGSGSLVGNVTSGLPAWGTRCASDPPA